MMNSDMPKFATLMISIGELYSQPVTEILIELYWKLLEHYEFVEIKNALEGHMRDADMGQYMPRPAHVIRAIEGSHQTRSLKAWTKVIKSMQQVGSYANVAFDDAIIHAVISDMGGWITVCATSSKELPFLAKDFQERYVDYLYKKPVVYPNYLRGLFATDNPKQVFEKDKVIFIGDKKIAKSIVVKDKALLPIISERYITPENIDN